MLKCYVSLVSFVAQISQLKLLGNGIRASGSKMLGF